MKERVFFTNTITSIGSANCWGRGPLNGCITSIVLKYNVVMGVQIVRPERGWLVKHGRFVGLSILARFGWLFDGHMYSDVGISVLCFNIANGDYA